MPADQMRGAAADAPGLGAGAGGFDQGRVIGQPEIVVAAKADQRLAVNHGVRAARRAQRALAALETVALQCRQFLV